MKLAKRLSLSSLILLVACAPRPDSSDTNNFPSLPTQNKELVTEQQLSNQGSTSTTANTLEPNTSSTASKTQDLTQNSSNAGNQSTTTITSRLPASWDISGAIAARSARKSWSASLNWLQRGANTYQIRLMGPLGSGSVMVQKQNGVISFRDGAKTSTSTNAESLLRQQTGISLPVSSLYYWVRGTTAPGKVQSAQRDASNRLIVLKQGGYTINYLGYSNINGMNLPTQIKLVGNGIFIKLAITRWKV